MWGLSFLTRDWTSAPALVVWILNNWDSQKTQWNFYLVHSWKQLVHFTTFSFFFPPSLPPFLSSTQVKSLHPWACYAQVSFIFQWSIVFFTFYFLLILLQNWSIVDLQCFRYRAKWFNYTHTHTHCVCVYICVCFFAVFSILGYYKILNIVPCALH